MLREDQEVDERRRGHARRSGDQVLEQYAVDAGPFVRRSRILLVEALGIQALALDLGCSFGIELYVDATAAQGIAARAGLGRVRHMETRVLWVQQALRDGKFRIRKVDGKRNPADILTKPLSAEFMRPLLGMVGAYLLTREVDEPVVGFVRRSVRRTASDSCFGSVEGHVERQLAMSDNVPAALISVLPKRVR